MPCVREIAMISFVTGAHHFPFQILWWEFLFGDDNFHDFKINFIARIDPGADMQCTILLIEWPTSIVWWTFGCMRTWWNARYNTTRWYDTICDFTEIISGRCDVTEIEGLLLIFYLCNQSVSCKGKFYLPVIQCKIGRPNCITGLSDWRQLVEIFGIPFQVFIGPTLQNQR